jgi:flagellar protein FliL
MVAPNPKMPSPRPASESPGRETEGASPEAKPAAGRQNALAPWLPLLVNVALLPLLAYLTMQFVLLPKFQREITRASGAAPEANSTETAKEEKESSSGHSEGAGAGSKAIQLSSKILVNVAGTQGTRYLLVNVALIGSANLKTLVDNSDAQLRDAASSILASKTIADLEKPGARNLIRTELISIFNTILGKGVIKEIYLTDFAIQ